MEYLEEYDFTMLENESEFYVKKAIAYELEISKEYCKCNRCVNDYVALALNNVPPKYKVTILGRLFDFHEHEMYLEIVKKAVSDSLDAVKKNPSHNQ